MRNADRWWFSSTRCRKGSNPRNRDCATRPSSRAARFQAFDAPVVASLPPRFPSPDPAGASRVAPGTMRLVRAAWLVSLALASEFITRWSLDYFRADLPAFVVEKLPLPWEQVWLGGLRVHVVAAALALPGCLLL